MDSGEVHALLVDAARGGGEIGLAYFGRRELETFIKSDMTPVTSADLAIDAYLRGKLGAYDPEIGWLSEESGDAEASLRTLTWVVDPIDGTRGFIEGGDDWVVSLALVREGRPVAAVIYRPVTGDLYEADLGAGACLNGRPLTVSDGTMEDIRVFSGPKAVMKQAAATMPIATWVRSPRSLALRLVQLAQGALDVAVVKANACHWDLAAAELILAESGGRLTTCDGRPLLFNEPNVRHPELVAAGPHRHEAFVSAFRAGRWTFG